MSKQVVKFRSPEWLEQFNRLSEVFGDEFLRLTLTQQNYLIRDITEDTDRPGVLCDAPDLGEYKRWIGAGNLTSYARTQEVRFLILASGDAR